VRMLNFIANKGVISDVGDSEITSMVSEIKVLKGLMTVMWNRCKDENELAMRAGPIGDLTQKIEKLVTSAHKLNKDLGAMLNEQQIEEFGREIIDIVSRHVTDTVVLEAIANDIAELETRRSDRLQQLGLVGSGD